MNETQMNYAQVLQGNTLSKPDALWYFGNEGEIRNYFKGDKNRFTGNTAEAFKTTLLQYFETVEEVKVKGFRGKQYRLGKAREELAERETKNSTNGKWNQSTKHLDAILLTKIQCNMENDAPLEYSISRWLKLMGVINHTYYELLTSTYIEDSRRTINSIFDNQISENTEDYSVDKKYSYDAKKFFFSDLNSIKSTFMSSLKRLKKHKIIDTYESPVAYLHKEIVDEEGNKERIIRLHNESYTRFKTKESELLNKHELTHNTLINNKFLNNKTLNSRVDNYKNELNDYLRNDFKPMDISGNKIESYVKDIYVNIVIIPRVDEDKVGKFFQDYFGDIDKDYIEFGEDKEGLFNIQKQKYEKCKKTEILTKAINTRNNKVEEAKILDENFGLKGFRASTFKQRYPRMKNAEFYFDDFVNLIHALSKVFKSGFNFNEKIDKNNKSNNSGKFNKQQINEKEHAELLDKAYENLTEEEREMHFPKAYYKEQKAI